MEQRALVLEKAPAEFVEPPPVQTADETKIIAYPSSSSVSLVDPGLKSNRQHKRREKLLRFIKFETTACFFLVLGLSAGTSKQVADADLMVPFEVVTALAILAVAIIPVIFYGPTRQRYRYHRRNLRDY